MAGLPYTKFYWNDWAGDPLLRTCSFAAQGLWMRLLCIAAESAEPGFVLLNGKPPEIEEIVKVTGGDVEEVRDLIRELHLRGVSGMDRRGAIYSRRLIREHQKREASAKGGRVGGTVSKDKKVGLFGSSVAPNVAPMSQANAAPIRGDNREIPPLASHGNESANRITRENFSRNHGSKPESRVQNRVFLGGKTEANPDNAIRLCQALGVEHDPQGEHHNWPGIIDRMIADDGFDFENHILAAAITLREAGRLPDEVRSPAFFRSEANKIVARGRSRPATIHAEEVDPATLTRWDWQKALRLFVESGRWFTPGPDPTRLGCLAPPDLLEKARETWRAQGDHPEFMDTDYNFRWKPHGTPGADRVMIWPKAVPIETAPPREERH